MFYYEKIYWIYNQYVAFNCDKRSYTLEIALNTIDYNTVQYSHKILFIQDVWGMGCFG